MAWLQQEVTLSVIGRDKCGVPGCVFADSLVVVRVQVTQVEWRLRAIGNLEIGPGSKYSHGVYTYLLSMISCPINLTLLSTLF